MGPGALSGLMDPAAAGPLPERIRVFVSLTRMGCCRSDVGVVSREQPKPAARVEFASGAIRQHSASPTPLFEDEHEDDLDAPGEWVRKEKCLGVSVLLGQ
jgi:hypothetical protein